MGSHVLEALGVARRHLDDACEAACLAREALDGLSIRLADDVGDLHKMAEDLMVRVHGVQRAWEGAGA